MKYDIASVSANIAYQLKVNKWYDKYSKAQIDSLYDNAAAALINAHSNERNSFINQYLAPAQFNSLNQGAALDYQDSLSSQWSRRKDKSLFPLTKQSIKLGVEMQTSQSGLLNYQLHDMNYGLNPARRWLGVGSWTPNILVSPSDLKRSKPKSVKGFRLK